jgi:hypothetical protein
VPVSSSAVKMDAQTTLFILVEKCVCNNLNEITPVGRFSLVQSDALPLSPNQGLPYGQQIVAFGLRSLPPTES